MRKLLAATTAIAVVGGVAFAEIMISGDAKLGMDYTSEPVDNNSKHSFKHEMGVDFTGSGTTDGGLTFGGKAGFDSGAGTLNTGTVFVSGSFGKVTIGDNEAADLLAGGIADVGLNDLGVDNVVEDIRGTTAKQFRYDHSVGNISLAVSAGTSDGVEGVANSYVLDDQGLPVPDDQGEPTPVIGKLEVKISSYAVGMSFSTAGATVGFGYDSKKTISAGVGYSTGRISANAFYAKGERPYNHLGSDFVPDNGGTLPEHVDGTFDAGMTGIGLDVSYTMGASTLTLSYAKTDVSNIQPFWNIDLDGNDQTNDPGFDFADVSFKGIGVGFSHDLGGGAKLVAGFGQVPTTAVADLGMEEIGQVYDGNNQGTGITADDRKNLSGDKNVASVGLSFTF